MNSASSPGSPVGRGLGNGAFEKNEDEGGAVVEEFLPEAQEDTRAERSQPFCQVDLTTGVPSLNRPEIEHLLDRLGSKKNLILQGPPGTGKTWLAKRLAFALMSQKDDSKVRVFE